MGVLRSKLGWALVVIYVVAFITVYSRVHAHRGTFQRVGLARGGRSGTRGAGHCEKATVAPYLEE
jgi:hypothetical protein